MPRIVLGLGSNKSYGGLAPLGLLQSACRALQEAVHAPLFSSVYRSRAMYVAEQDDFYNMAVTGFFDGSPQELLGQCHRIEAAHGRERQKEFRNGPRSLDIDIELFGHERLAGAELTIPHERLQEREFVLRPMLEILPLCADVKEEFLEPYEAALSALGPQGVEKVLGRNEFTEAVYGRKSG